MSLFDELLNARGLTGEKKKLFLSPIYPHGHDPFLLPDMDRAVERLIIARERQDRVTIYGDYDIDGLTATTLLLDAFSSFGFQHVDTFMPNRFIEGYGLTSEAMEKIAKTGTQLIVTVDCGSLSHKEITKANELGMEVIVTDHHNVTDTPPPAVATINPKRQDHDYPFIDLAGVGVAFKLVQALQTQLEGLPAGQEKWLLDLVALGTVCDVVTLLDENRANVYYGLKVLARTRRPGLKALMAVARVDPNYLTTRSLGFALGPRMNAAGRLETAQYALDLLRTTDPIQALEKAMQLDEMNTARRRDQDVIFKNAILQAEQRSKDPVLVVSHQDWNHGIIGVVAAKLLEKYKKPVYILQEMGDTAKGSARSYGDFSVADAIRASDDIITSGGGHKLAAGVTLPTANIDWFRVRVNEFYRSLTLKHQAALLLPKAEVIVDSFIHLTESLLTEIQLLEPFGNGNPEPIFKSNEVLVVGQHKMGAEGQHVKLELQDNMGAKLHAIAFSAPEHFFVEPGEKIHVWYQPLVNEWQGKRSIEGRLLHLELA
jgi:single-stranded-DNA-specific exonuclease